MKINNLNFYKKKHLIFRNDEMKYEIYFDILFNVLNKINNKKYNKDYVYSVLYKDVMTITQFIGILNFYDKNRLTVKDYIEIPQSSQDIEEMMINDSLINSIYNLKIFLNKKYTLKFKIYNKIYKKIILKKNNIYQNFFNILEKLFIRNKKVYFDIINIKLYLKSLLMGYIPILFDKDRVSDKINLNNEYDYALRKKIIKEIMKENLSNEDYSNLNIIILLLPITKIESFEKFNNFYEKFEHNRNDVIMLSYTRYSDKSSYWLANKFSITSKTFYYQYGSGIGTGDNHHHIEYNFKIFKTLLTWNSKKNIKGFINYQIPCIYKFNQKKIKKYDILFVNTDNPYYAKNNNGPTFLQVKKALKDQIIFLNNLSTKFNTIVKNQNYSYDYANIDQVYNEFKHDNKIKKIRIKDLVSESRLIISTYYGTTLFQMMSNDIPNILVIRKSHYKFEKEFNYFLHELKKHNFLFYNSKNAADFINKNFHIYLDNWKNNEKFIKLRAEFRKKYCKNNLGWQNIVVNKIFKKQN
jgi:putative transferase (TIGR04331 family)